MVLNKDKAVKKPLSPGIQRCSNNLEPVRGTACRHQTLE